MSVELVIGNFHTGLALGDDFFCGHQHLTEEHLIPVIHSLTQQVDGIIKDPGIYKFTLEVTKIK